MATPPRNYRELHGSERRPTPGARVLGPADENEKLRVTIVLRRRPDGAQVPGPSYYLRTPPSERPRLSETEFAARYGADPDEIEKVRAFARAQGLTVEETNAARRTVVVSGTVGQFSTAFEVKLQIYEHEVERSPRAGKKTESYRGRDGFIHVPADLVDVIIGVFGLDNRRITKRGLADPPNTNPIPITTVLPLYNFPPNLAAGQTIAIFSEAGYLPSDIATNFPVNPPSVIDVPVDAPNNGAADPNGQYETTQDIYIAASVAPGAQIAVYFTTYTQQGWVDLLARVIHPSLGLGDPQCSVLSSSFYVSNGDDAAALAAASISISWIIAVTQMLEDAAIQGVTFCTCSGDNGADAREGDGQAHVWYPATDPWALACGGTTIGNVIAANCDEWAWADNTGASGGGVSDYFPIPWYQSDTTIPVSVKDGHRGRGVPDVAANASPNSGYPFTITLLGVTSVEIANGTSASAPLWAGLIAVMNAALGQNVGFINPVIYALNGAGFRDILPEPGASDNSFAGVPGYPVTPGWDAVTGWGTPKGVELLHALRHFYGPAIAVNLQDNLHFGTVCRGPAYLVIHVYNVGNRDLMILSVKRVAGSTDFTVLPMPITPLAIAPGAQIDFTVAFNPTATGLPEFATIQIISNDPVRPVLDLRAEGTGGAGALETVIADHGAFGDCCVGSHRDEPLTLHNNGPCNLTITAISSSSIDFVPPGVSTYPLIIAPGASIAVPIRFQPVAIGSFAGVITVHTSHPTGLRHVDVSGVAPAGKLAVTGSAIFGAVPACCRVERTISICNVGACKLHVSSVAFKRKSKHWKLVNNPFPAMLHPGSCLAVVIRYIATEKLPRSCDLVITSDDPGDPVKTLEVMATTVWEQRCAKCCDDCRKGCCEKQHCDPCRCHKCAGECDDADHDDDGD